ncbi:MULTISPECIES: hypothetical protein [Rossellomorea]|uniref:Uncharacterized protein n=1 Tax=Rossellomorea vietnamensis TaxID=218284 RepID=A0A6I6UHY1_9BACI|nr:MULTISPECIES: hypothetical protein [Rossellomorea]QHE62564.1 hypothetical protein FHE72_17195 [Rossellomorea vietnamensis]WGG44642.1 hypothetical protein P8596_17985 [Rossellomorea sp. DA94]
MFSVDNYIGSIKSNIEKQSDLLVRNLEKIIAYNFSSYIDLLDFSTFIEHTRFELSIRMFAMDKEANEVFYEGNDTTVFAGSVEVIPDVKYYQLNDNILDDFIDNFYEKNYPEIEQLEQKVFTDWFSQCWKKAGGDTLDLPSYFVFHDDYKSFDLKKNQWIDDEEKWS